MTSTATIRCKDEIGLIRPELYGHFIEHLGSAIYNGIWVGEDSSIPNIGGLRKAAVEYLQALKVPVLRWPGGCFADAYHWRDGIGRKTDRPRRLNLWWDGAVEDNSFGTHEFMELCKLIRARPYLAGNLGSGTPAELHDWVEYCNNPFGTTLADERMANGAPGPFGVRYWGIGNEAWGCGGHLNAEEYCALYSRFATYVPTYGDTKPFLIAVGPESNDLEWTQRFFSSLRTTRRYAAPLHGIAMHFYSWGKSKPTEYTRETLKDQLDRFADLEKAIIDQRSALDTFATDPKIGKVGLIIDEWGTWDVSDEIAEKKFGKFWQQNTMKDAVAAGLALNVFHRQCDKLVMCNLAQTVNVLQALLLTNDDNCLRTPTYYTFLLCLKHRGNTAVNVDHPFPWHLSLSASRSARDIVVTAINPDPDKAVELTCTVDGPGIAGAIGQMLHHDDWNSCNAFDAPDTIVPLPVTVKWREHDFTVELPRFTLATLTIQLSV